jgi:hypothetical protein
MIFVKSSTPDGDPTVVLDISDLPVPEEEKSSRYLSFITSEYSKLKKKEKREAKLNWDKVYNPVNKFIQTLPEESQVAMARLYASQHEQIVKYVTEDSLTKPDVSAFLDELGREWLRFEQSCNMWTRIIQFIKDGNIRIAEEDFINAGDRPQDTELMTFRLEHGIAVTGFALMSKIMSPLFAVAMLYFNRLEEFTTDVKTIYIANIVYPILQTECPNMLDKFRNYVEAFVYKYLYEDPRKTLAAITKASESQLLMGKIFIQAFVNMDMGSQKNNPLNYVRSTVARAIKHLSVKNQFSVRDPAFWQNDDGSTSGALEVDSAVSRTPFANPIIARCMAETMAYRVMDFYGIEPAEYKSCYDFYMKHPFVPNPIAIAIVSGFFGPFMGGGAGIQHLNMPQFTSLTTVTQLVCFIPGYHTLGHLLTSLESPELREQSAMEALLINETSRNDEYRKCAERYSILSPSVWEQSINELVIYITKTNHVTNTAPLIWEHIGQSNNNGKVIPLDSSIGRQIAAFCYNYIGGDLACRM